MIVKKKQKEKKPFYEEFAEKIIGMLENGTAPWVKPWKPAKYLTAHNPVSGTLYKGINRIILTVASWGDDGYRDSRWMTFKQAQDKGWQVRKGERGQHIIFFSPTAMIAAKDEDGTPLLDEEGRKIKKLVRLKKPIMRSVVVFNAEQIDGCPPLQVPEMNWNPCEKVENVVKNCGVEITHEQVDAAFYNTLTDSIHMPPRETFPSAIAYYDVLLHEMAHSTGHNTRFARDFSQHDDIKFYAREELRAEIASWMAGLDLGIGHNPHNSAAYVAEWIKNLKKDPQEIIRACRDAQRISEALVMMADGPVNWDDLREKSGIKEEPPAEPQQEEKTWLDVPYARRFAAKKAGAKWDADARRWHAPEGADMDALAEFLPERHPSMSMMA